MLFVVPVVLFDMLKAKQLACVSESGQKCPAARSLSLRRAWIEIPITSHATRGLTSLSLRRAWIEINNASNAIYKNNGRSPYGERGLKLIETILPSRHVQSLSLRRAWIEIDSVMIYKVYHMSLSLRRAWIEIDYCCYSAPSSPSLSLRRAWIEISPEGRPCPSHRVALLTESVD